MYIPAKRVCKFGFLIYDDWNEIKKKVGRQISVGI